MLGEKRLAKALVAGALILTGLVGCGNQAQDQASKVAETLPEPTSAQELLTRWEENPNSKNNHSDLDIQISADFLGQKLEMPIKLSYDLADDCAHGNAEMDLSSIGSEKVSSELYIEKDGDKFVQYSTIGNSDDATWYKTTSDNDYLTKQFSSAELLADATFAKTDDGYTLTIPATKLLEAMSDSDEMSGLLGNVDNKAVQDALSKSEATYQFDKDCNLKNVSFEVAYSVGDDQSSDEQSLSSKMNINFTLAFSNYGGIDPASVKVPEDIKKTAVDTGAADGSTDASKADDSTAQTTEQKNAA